MSDSEPSSDGALNWLDLGEQGELDATVDVLPPPAPEGIPDLDPHAQTLQVDPPKGLSELPRLGRYMVLGRLGQGGMGVVYLARDQSLRRRVALKHGGDFASDPQARLRFVSEAQITSQLDHPGIVPVYSLDAGCDGGVAYAMKVVRGTELAARIDEARAIYEREGADAPALRRAQRELVEQLVRVCETMGFAHQRGVIHRDLKPENLMLGAHQEVYVMDWGLAKVIGRPEAETPGSFADDLDALSELPVDTQTLAGSIKGTPIYMAPEQARGELDRLGPAADIYALGMILYEVLYLQRARAGETLRGVIEAAQVNELAPPPEDLEANPELEAIFRWATQEKPEDRYAAVADFAEDLRAHLRGAETRALPDNGWRKLRRKVARHPTPFLGAFVSAVIGSLLLVAGLVAWQQLEQVRARVAAEREARAEQAVRARATYGLDRVANHFLYYGSLSASLSASTARVLEHARPGELRLYPSEAFAQLEGAPPGTAAAAGYGGRLISPQAFVGRSAPGAPPAAAERQRRLLGHLLDPAREAILAGAPGSLARWKVRGPAEQDAAILEHDTPLEWVYVALEETGTIGLFPGSTSTWTEDYDPRTRSWYREAKRAFEEEGKRRNWSRPYLDLMGQGIVITYTEACLDREGQFVGVVALDLSFEDTTERYLRWKDLPGVTRTTIVRSGGEVFMTSEPFREKLREDGTLDLGHYDDETALLLIRSGQIDHVVRGDLLSLWVKAPGLGWTLIVDVDLPTLRASQAGAD